MSSNSNTLLDALRMDLPDFTWRGGTDGHISPPLRNLELEAERQARQELQDFVLWLNGAMSMVGEEPPSQEQWAKIRDEVGRHVGHLVAQRLTGSLEEIMASTRFGG